MSKRKRLKANQVKVSWTQKGLDWAEKLKIKESVQHKLSMLKYEVT